MKERTLGVSKGARACYMDEFLNENKKLYTSECDDNYVYYTVADSDGWLVPLICEIIVLFDKFDEVSRHIRPKNGCSYPVCAYMGSVLSIDAKLEKEQIIPLIPDDAFINLAGIYNFCMNEVRASWQSLGVLSGKLYAQCKTERDIYSLTSFMLGVENESATLTVDKQEIITLNKDGKSLKVPNFFDNSEMNAITTILANSPSEIVINGKDAFSPQFMELMHRIGV